MIHSKVIDHEKLDELQRDVIFILCQLKMYFLPSFFDFVVHLMCHIIEEIKLAGLVFLRYMYPFERYMGFLKGYVRNRYRPEGSIVQEYDAEEVVQFCKNYMDDVADISLPQPRHQGRFDGVGTIGRKDVTLTNDDFEQAHFTVLQNMTYKVIRMSPTNVDADMILLGTLPNQEQEEESIESKIFWNSYMRLISIMKKNWKQVTKEEKKLFVAHFRLENDDVKKRTLVSCGTKWKAFKTKLRVKFMVKNVSPLQKWSFIQPNVWEELCQNENTPGKMEEHQGEQNESISTWKVDVPSSVHRRSSLISTTSIVKLPCKKETYYCLYIPSSVLAGEKVACAIATVYPIGDGTVHFKKLLKGHMKVSVIKVVEIHKSMELPVPDDEIPNLESANAPSTKKEKGNETAKEPNKQEKPLEETTKHQKMIQNIDEVKEQVNGFWL
nr:hypothetical protein [Tanacetum cinerariifolium]